MGKVSYRCFLIVPLCLIWSQAAIGDAAAQTITQTSLTRTADQDPEMQRILTELNATGARLVAAKTQEEIVFYSLRQADVLARLINRSKSEEQPALIRQMAECLHAAAQCSPTGDRTAHQQLIQLEGQVDRARPGSELAASITFLEMQAEYETALTVSGKDTAPASRQRGDRLARFVGRYPNATETPGALLELAALYEASGQREDARANYLLFAEQFPRHAQAVKARRTARWLALPGRTEFLVLPLLFTDDERLGLQFDIEQLRGHVVVVYFWESTNPQCAADLAALGALKASYQEQGLEVVCVSLDEDPAAARAFLGGQPTVGVHVIARGGAKGVAGPLAERLGLASLPRWLILGKDGKIAGQAVQSRGLEAQITEQLKQPAVTVSSAREIGRRFPWTRLP